MPETSKPLDFKNLTQEYILEIARSHSKLRRIVAMWRLKNLTWEETTYAIILSLIQSNSELFEKYSNLLHQTPPTAIKISDEYCERLGISPVTVQVSDEDCKRLGIKPIELSEDGRLFIEAIELCESELRKNKLY